MPAVRLFFVNHPPSVYPRFILPFAKPPSEFLHFHHRSSPFDVSSPTQGFGPPRDNTEARPLIAGFLRRLRSTLRLSQPFGGFLRSSALRALFHPAATFRVPLPYRGFLPPHSRPSSSESLTPMPLPHHPLTSKPAATGHASRLRGLSPCRDTFLQFSN
jgi:hypothetical protein